MIGIAKHTLCSPIILRYIQHMFTRMREHYYVDYRAICTYTPSVDVQYAITEDTNLKDVEIWLYTSMGRGTVHRLNPPFFKHLRKYVRKTLIHNIDKEV